MKNHTTRLKAGDKAPTFSGKDQNGKKVSLKDFAGKKLVLYFYPKDNTPTCTVEACNLRDNYSLLKRKGIVVLGMSKDPVKSHTKFAKKFSLPFPLLSDEEGNTLIEYDVYGEKILYGRKYMGIYRTTFLIDEKGKILEVITDVDSKDHAQQIMDLLNK